MKCNQCGTEFKGKFCPECGAKMEAESLVTPPPIQPPQQQFYQQVASMQSETPKKNKKSTIILPMNFGLTSMMFLLSNMQIMLKRVREKDSLLTKILTHHLLKHIMTKVISCL